MSELNAVLERLDSIEAKLTEYLERQQERQWYTVAEFAALTGRALFTVREWCRHKRINAKKKDTKRGRDEEWAISHAELLRFQEHGLLPLN